MQTKFTYTEAFLRRAIFRYWLRFIGSRGFSLIGIISASSIWAVCCQDEPALMCVCVVVWLMVLSVAAGVYFTMRRRTLEKLRRMNDPTAEVTISSDEFRLKSSLGDSRLQSAPSKRSGGSPRRGCCSLEKTFSSLYPPKR